MWRPAATLNETALDLFAAQIRSPTRCSLGNAIASSGLKWQYIAIIATFCSFYYFIQKTFKAVKCFEGCHYSMINDPVIQSLIQRFSHVILPEQQQSLRDKTRSNPNPNRTIAPTLHQWLGCALGVIGWLIIGSYVVESTSLLCIHQLWFQYRHAYTLQ